VSYANSYTEPVVLGQVLTTHDADWSVLWAYGSSRKYVPSASTLHVGKHVSEDPDKTRADEDVGFLVIEAGSTTIDGRDCYADVSSDTIRGVDNGPPYSLPLSGLGTVETAVVGLMAMDGNDGGWARLYGSSPVDGSGIDAAIDEDELSGSERRHTTEQVGYLACEE